MVIAALPVPGLNYPETNEGGEFEESWKVLRLICELIVRWVDPHHTPAFDAKLSGLHPPSHGVRSSYASVTAAAAVRKNRHDLRRDGLKKATCSDLTLAAGCRRNPPTCSASFGYRISARRRERQAALLPK
jgi:hypothetical protein